MDCRREELRGVRAAALRAPAGVLLSRVGQLVVVLRTCSLSTMHPSGLLTLCPLVYNPYQEDTWGTSEGDACESGSGVSEIYQVWAKIYEHSNYNGIEEVIRVDDVLLSGNAIGDDAMSSIRVGPHTAVYLYTLPNEPIKLRELEDENKQKWYIFRIYLCMTIKIRIK